MYFHLVMEDKMMTLVPQMGMRQIAIQSVLVQPIKPGDRHSMMKTALGKWQSLILIIAQKHPIKWSVQRECIICLIVSWEYIIICFCLLQVTTYPDSGCVKSFTGTSASAPLMTGVILLALEVK